MTIRICCVASPFLELPQHYIVGLKAAIRRHNFLKSIFKKFFSENFGIAFNINLRKNCFLGFRI